MNPTVKLTGKTHEIKILKDITDLEKLQVYVGIPERKAIRPKKKGAKQPVNNAQLLFIHTNGSPIRGIPKRPVIESAIVAKGNVEPITAEMGEAIKSSLDGDVGSTMMHLKRAGLTGENASRNWFTDSRNNWPPNKPSTIKRKGSSRPLIDTSEMRKSITSIVVKE